MRMPAAVLFVGAVVSTAISPGAAAQNAQGRGQTVVERPFAAGGRITMDLAAGEYLIRGATADRIRVHWRVDDAARPEDVRVTVDVRGREATIRSDREHDSDFMVGIEVPSRSHLHVRLTAGELDIRGIEGDKDVELHAGELDIDVVRAEDYKHVDAGVWAGELHATAFRIVKEGLFRSFDWSGNGPYRLHAHLKAGEMRLHAGTATAR